jgi:hypothetical protein
VEETDGSVGLKVMPIDSVTLSDERGPGERAPTRRSVLEQLLQPGPFEACRTGSSVALVISGGYAAEFSGPELFRLAGRGL